MLVSTLPDCSLIINMIKNNNNNIVELRSDTPPEPLISNGCIIIKTKEFIFYVEEINSFAINGHFGKLNLPSDNKLVQLVNESLIELFINSPDEIKRFLELD